MVLIRGEKPMRFGSLAARCMALSLLVGMGLAFCGPVARAQSAKRILARHLKAVGGKAALERVEDRVERWSLTIEAYQSVDQAEVVIKSKRPDRFIRTVDGEYGGQPLHQIRAYDGSGGWQISRGAFSNMQGADLDHYRNRALRANGADLLRLEEIGGEAKVIGKEDVEGKKAHVIEVTLEGSPPFKYYIDTKTYLILKTEEITKFGGTEFHIHSWPQSYRTVDGLKIADEIEALQTIPEYDNEILLRFKLEEVQFNTGLADAAFAVPPPDQPPPPPPPPPTEPRRKKEWY